MKQRVNIALAAQETNPILKTQSGCLRLDVRPEFSLAHQVQAAVRELFLNFSKSPEQSQMIFLLIETTDVQQRNGFAQAVVFLGNAAGKVDSVVNHRDFDLIQLIKLGNGLLHRRTQSNRYRPSPGKIETADDFFSLSLRFLLGHIMYRMDTGFYPCQPCGSCPILNGIQVGVYHVRLLPPEHTGNFPHHGKVQSRLLIQVNNPDPRLLHPLGDGSFPVVEADDQDLMSQVPQPIAEIFTHGLCAAKAEIGNHLDDLHVPFTPWR